MARRKPTDAKRKALQEQGTVHRRPEAVTDALFRTHQFFDPRDLVQIKYEMLRRVRVEGQSVTHAAAAFGLSRLSFYQAQAAFEQAGVTGLLPKKRGPHGPHKLTDEVMTYLQQVQANDPSLRASRLAEMVNKKFGILIHARTIERAFGRREKKREPRVRATGR